MHNGSATIRALSGAMTLQTIADTHAVLQSDLMDHEFVSVDVTGIGDVDVTFIQLLLSAQLTAAQEGKALTLCGVAPESLLTALARGGFTGASDDPPNPFWSPEPLALA